MTFLVYNNKFHDNKSEIKSAKSNDPKVKDTIAIKLT